MNPKSEIRGQKSILSALLLLAACWSSQGAFIDPFGSASNWNNRDLGVTNYALPNVSGNVDVYTCPAGLMAYVSMLAITTNGSTVTVTNRTATNGVYTSFSTATVTSNTVAAISPSALTGIFVQNETCALGFTAPCNLWVTAITWPLTYPIRAPRLYSLSAGTNLLFQVPAGFSAAPVQILSPINNYVLGGFNYNNLSGTSREIKVYIVPNGAAIDFTNRIFDGTILTANAKSGNLPTLNPLDSVVFEVDAATAVQSVVMSPFILRTVKSSP